MASNVRVIAAYASNAGVPGMGGVANPGGFALGGSCIGTQSAGTGARESIVGGGDGKSMIDGGAMAGPTVAYVGY